MVHRRSTLTFCTTYHTYFRTLLSFTARTLMELTVQHGKRMHTVQMTSDATIGTLKSMLQDLTKVNPKRQKLLGIPPADDSTMLSQLKLKPKVVLMGTPDEEMTQSAQNEMNALEDQQSIVDDFDVSEVTMPPHRDSENLAKVQERASRYTPHQINEPREGKKLLVLDVSYAANTPSPLRQRKLSLASWFEQVDYTLFDHRSPAENAMQLARPHLHSFLERVYPMYDIVIW